jgi:DNA polymerase III delta prime subunit
MSKEFLFVEKYRPQTVRDCILPDRIKKTFQDYVDKKQIPNLLLSGPPGIGKTTIAIALCEEIGVSWMMINSSDERGIDTLRTKIKNYASTVSLMSDRKVVILDEADYITPEAQAAFRGTIEEFSGNCSFIFTCNFKARLIDAIHSRCAVVDFSLQPNERPYMAKAFVARIETILTKEGITYDKNVILKLVEKYFPDYRRLLNELQRFGSSGAIDAGTLTQLSALRRFEDLVKFLKEKDFTEMRKWVIQNSDIDAIRIFRRVYDSLYDVLKPEDIPQAVILVAKYQYRDAFVADHEINLVAFLTELMVSCTFK